MTKPAPIMRRTLAIIAVLISLAGCGSHQAPEDLAARLDNWVVEKWEGQGASVQAQNGALSVTTHSKEDGVMVWLRREVPLDFVFEYDFRPLSDSGFFLLFFCAQGVSGEDVLGDSVQSDRTARTLFKKYTEGKVRCYHISYRRGEQANCNLRKNPGLMLLKQETINSVLPQGRTVHVKLSKLGGHILLEVGGKIFMDYNDPDHPLEGGRLALRQVYDSAAVYSNVKLTDGD